jgi:hypothetical protein
MYVRMYCGVAPKGHNIERSLLVNGYAPNSSFISTDYNGTLPREISQRNNKTRKPTTEQLKAVFSIRYVQGFKRKTPSSSNQ